MCSFRDGYHYKNATEDAQAFKFLKSVPDSHVLRTDRDNTLSLEQLCVLRTFGHQCDRSYQHTDFQVCYAAATVAQICSGSSYTMQPVLAPRT